MSAKKKVKKRGRLVAVLLKLWIMFLAEIVTPIIGDSEFRAKSFTHRLKIGDKIEQIYKQAWKKKK